MAVGTLLVTLGVILSLLKVAESGIFVVAPNVLNSNEQGTVSVLVTDRTARTKVTLSIQANNQVHSSVKITVFPDIQKIVNMRVDGEKLGAPDTNGQHYVQLRVQCTDCGNFDRKTDILVNKRTGTVFLQTDKPLYSPGQTVTIRVFTLDEDRKAANMPIRMEIKDPNGIIILRKRGQTRTGLLSSDFKIPRQPISGFWKILLHFGMHYSESRERQIEVKKYVLPNFQVKVHGLPEYIYSITESVHGSFKARYSFDANVVGKARVIFRVVTGSNQTSLNKKFYPLQNGNASFRLDAADMATLNLTNLLHSKSHLEIEIIVTETSTGISEKVLAPKCYFATSPYVISFKGTPTNFMPGLPFQVKITASYITGTALPHTDLEISTTDQYNRPVERSFDGRRITNSQGVLHYYCDIRRDIRTIKITVNVEGDLRKTEHVIHKAVMPGYMTIGHQGSGTLRPGVNARFEALLTDPNNLMRLQTLLVSGGRISDVDHEERPGSTHISFTRHISFINVPSVRMVTWYFRTDNQQLVAASTKFQVERKCKTEVEVKNAQIHQSVLEPVATSDMILKGAIGAKVKTVVVDKAVYFMNNGSRLTRKIFFDEFESHDLGCGMGGGANATDVFTMAGLTVLSDIFTHPRRETLDGTQAASSGGRHRRSTNEDDWGLIEEESGASRRADFPESWLYSSTIARSGETRKTVTLPGSITTWVFQAVTMSEIEGECVSEPYEQIVRTDVFIKVHLPYTAVLGEQMELAATVYNLGNEIRLVRVSLLIEDGICSTVSVGRYSHQYQYVQGRMSWTARWPIIPTKQGKIRITVKLHSSNRLDIVRETFNVVPSGEFVVTPVLEITQDPSGSHSTQQSSKGREGSLTYSVWRDIRGVQRTIINLDIPQDALPDTAVMKFTLYGDAIGIRCMLSFPTENTTHVFKTDNTNQLVLQTHEVTEHINDMLIIECNGTGVTHTAVEMTYYSAKSQQDTCSFSITAQAIPINNAAHEAKTIKVCTSQKDLDQKLLMPMLDVGLGAGFIPVVQTLELLRRQKENKVDFYEVNDRSVVLYMKEIPSGQDLCIRFDVTRSQKMNYTQPVPVKVYAYYEPDKIRCRTFYDPLGETAGMLDVECDSAKSSCTCLENRCPPCYGYDSVSSDATSPILTEDKLESRACSGLVDYVHVGEVLYSVKKDGERKYTIRIENVIKPGNESKTQLIGEERVYVVRNKCQDCGLESHHRFLIMGQDGPNSNNGEYQLTFNSYIVRLYSREDSREWQSSERRVNKIHNRFIKDFQSCQVSWRPRTMGALLGTEDQEEDDEEESYSGNQDNTTTDDSEDHPSHSATNILEPVPSSKQLQNARTDIASTLSMEANYPNGTILNGTESISLNIIISGTDFGELKIIHKNNECQNRNCPAITKSYVQGNLTHGQRKVVFYTITFHLQNELSCENLTHTDGWYRFVATKANGSGTWEDPKEMVFFLQYLPIWMDGPDDLPAVIGDYNTSITCDVCTDPQAVFNWTLNQHPLPEDIIIDQSRARITIPEVKVHHVGHYVCTVTRSIDGQEHQTTFTVGLWTSKTPSAHYIQIGVPVVIAVIGIFLICIGIFWKRRSQRRKAEVLLYEMVMRNLTPTVGSTDAGQEEDEHKHPMPTTVAPHKAQDAGREIVEIILSDAYSAKSPQSLQAEAVGHKNSDSSSEDNGIETSSEYSDNNTPPATLPLWDGHNPRVQGLVCLDQDLRDVLRRNLVFLTTHVHPIPLFSHLRQLCVINSDEQEDIELNTTRRGMVDRMVQRIDKGPVWHLHAFYRALVATNQGHLLNTLGVDGEVYHDLTPVDLSAPPSTPRADVPDLMTWLRQNDVSVHTCTRLQEETVKDATELKMMTWETIRSLHISVGEQIRLWACVQKLQQMDRQTSC